MSWSWNNITFDVQEPNKNILEASANPRTREQAIYDFTKQKWDNEHIAPHNKITIMFGGIKLETIENYINEYFSTFDFINKAAVVFVTDDGHMGYGKVYENNEGERKLLKEYKGYQKAKGHDVAGMISDDFHIKPTADRMW